MNRKKTPMVKVSLVIDGDGLAKFTTLLQSGFLLDVPQGESIGDLLASLPGFSRDYIMQRVQTIFLDGLPADDLDQQLFGEDAVVALSAAMPGLAGAIFRKNGIHASLRTTADRPLSKSPVASTPITVRLKMFNMIAVEKGDHILSSGCTLAASSLAKFLDYRHTLSSQLKSLAVNGQNISLQELFSLLEKEDTIELTVRSSHAS